MRNKLNPLGESGADSVRSVIIMKVMKVATFLVVLLSLEISESCLTLNGSAQEFASLDRPRRNGGFDSSDLILTPAFIFICSGQVISFQAYMEEARVYSLIAFQVRRSTDNCSYVLMGEHRVDNYAVGNSFLVDTASVQGLNPVAVEPGDVLSIYVSSSRARSSVQQYANDGNRVFVITGTPNQLSRTPNVCTGSNVAVVTGAPIINAIVEETTTIPPTTSFSTTTPVPPTTTSSTFSPPTPPTTSPFSTTALPTTFPTTSPITSSTTPTDHTSPNTSPTSTASTTATISSSTAPRPPTTTNTPTNSSTFTAPTTLSTDESTSPSSSPPTTSSTLPPTDPPLRTIASSDTVSTEASGLGETTSETETESQSIVVIAGLVVGLLVLVLVVLGGILIMCCCIVCRRMKEPRSFNPNLSDQHLHQTNAYSMHVTKAEFEGDAIYDQIGPDESKLDSMEFARSIEASAAYEVPVTCSRNQKDSLPEIPLPRCNTYEVPDLAGIPSMKPKVTSSSGNGEVQERKGFEASNVYETPMDAENRRKEAAAAELNASNADYTPMASVWNYTQYKKT